MYRKNSNFVSQLTIYQNQHAQIDRYGILHREQKTPGSCYLYKSCMLIYKERLERDLAKTKEIHNWL